MKLKVGTLRKLVREAIMAETAGPPPSPREQSKRDDIKRDKLDKNNKVMARRRDVTVNGIRIIKQLDLGYNQFVIFIPDAEISRATGLSDNAFRIPEGKEEDAFRYAVSIAKRASDAQEVALELQEKMHLYL